MAETTNNRLDENRALLDLNVAVDSVDNSDMKTLPNNTKNIDGILDNVLNEAECLEPKTIISENEYKKQGSEDSDKLHLGNVNSLYLSVTNCSVSANGTCTSDDNTCLVPGPNFMENSLCSNEDNLNLSRSPNHYISDCYIVHDNIVENSFESKDFEKAKFPTSLDQDSACFPATNQNTIAEKSTITNCSQSDALIDNPVDPEPTVSNNYFSEPFPVINVIADENIERSRNLSKDEGSIDGEEFQDAVQFFEDPLSFTFLENIKTSDQTESVVQRNSLYMTFDPLHEKYVQLAFVPDNVSLPFKESVNSDTVDTPVNVDKETVLDVAGNNLPVENKLLTSAAQRKSFGNILLSFDSPMKSNYACSSSKTNNDCSLSEIPKLHTEEELQQAVKIIELSNQEVYLKKQREIEEESKKSNKVKEEQIKKLGKVISLRNIVEELVSVLSLLSEENQLLSSKILELESEKQKLCDDLKTSSEDLQSVEHTFADFHKRYEQCKGMLKAYKDNEGNLKLQVESLNNKLKEQEQKYNMLQEKTEEMVEKANTEVANVKKGGDAQIAVVSAQLKKSELKVSSLKSDLKQVKIENDKLSGICDDLMTKVSES